MATTPPSFSKFFMASTHVSSGSKEARDLKKLSCTKSMAPEKVELFKSIEDWARDSILPLLKPVEKSWQPGDLLPDSASDGFVEQVKELRERAKEIPDDYLVAIFGNMITEEALPMYQSESVAQKFIVMKPAETTLHGRFGLEVGVLKRIAMEIFSIIYTSVQERATCIAHGNTAKLALQHGDSKLAQICGTIASDEKRHETAYSRIVGKLFELDPTEAMVAFADMLKIRMIMPGDSMYNGRDEHLFDHVLNVLMRIGVYTIADYINVLEHFVGV
ncbi:hypothetical protein Patl1_26768 [Pistacia atlantica]|uniref:Uncharacterized protein n=1 Tax=Pistacia atlantica TaxID=434234 RepID=A0ACC1B095_9ROSI|nr:hypothetical protein Patl1_26768 [Pistacia atlantica]